MSVLVCQYQTQFRQTIQVRQGDLTEEDTDAIVNAANSRLQHGAGVAGAIVRKGGNAIQLDSDQWIDKFGLLPTGQVAVTSAGKLPTRSIIHAVGPIWQGGAYNEDELLHLAVWNSLAKAEEMSLASIALPAISSGIFGFPKERCATILVETALEFYSRHPQSHLRQVRFTNIDQITVDIFEAEVQKLDLVQRKNE